MGNTHVVVVSSGFILVVVEKHEGRNPATFLCRHARFKHLVTTSVSRKTVHVPLNGNVPWWGLCRRARQILSGCTRVGFCVISIRGQRKSSARNIFLNFWKLVNSLRRWHKFKVTGKQEEPPTWRHELGNIFSQFGDSVSVVPLRRSVTFGYDFLVHSWCVGSWFSQQPGGGGLRRRRRGCYKSQEVSLLLCSCHAVQEFIKSHQCLFQ